MTTPTVVYIHGIGDKPAAEQLKQEWDRALFGAPMGAQTRMAYWAHLRGAGEVEALPAAVESPEAFIETTSREITTPTDSLESLQTSPLIPWLRDMTYAADAVADGESLAESQFEVLPLPAPLRKAAFRALVKVALIDVHTYFFGGRGGAIQSALQQVLDDISGPVIVIAHSLGSVVAYDELRRPANQHRSVPLFVTLGSPLAVTEIQDLVATPLKVPDPVAAWRNYCDARDVVALDKTVRGEYDPAAACTDVLVVNETENHHGIGPYLRAAAVREAVTAVLGSTPASARR